MILEQIKNAPNTSGVYQFLDKNDQVLYVGKAKNLKKRLQNYTQPNKLSSRIAHMVSLATKIQTINTKTETEALLLECNLIKKLKPRYNILLRDDKSFPYILLSDSAFPQILKHRGKRSKKGHYFGPFASAHDVNKTIDILKKSFLIRGCSDAEFNRRKKPCLEYQIKRCCAPCTNLISQEDYQKLIDQSLDFLNGKNSKIQEDLAKKMQDYSEQMEYEKALVIRDRIKALSSIQAKQNINLLWLKDADVIVLVRENNLACIYISFFRSGYNYGSKPYFINVSDDQSDSLAISAFLGQFYLNQTLPKTLILSCEPEDIHQTNNFLNEIAKKNIKIITPQKGNKYKLISQNLEIASYQLKSRLNSQNNINKSLIELKNILDLTQIPKRIEIYDNSHISGQDMVGAMVVAGPEGFIKNSYRKFNSKLDKIDKKDDTAMLKHVLKRRFKRVGEEKWVKPDLLIIDGGKGQLSAAKEIFEELEIKDIKYICMSKGPNRNAGEEYFHQPNKESFTLPKTDPLMYYLQNLRDEAHRFAIGTHRKKRAKSITKSGLDQITNIGQKRKKLLLQHFGSIAAIKDATLEDLYRIDGISKKIAKKIKDEI